MSMPGSRSAAPPPAPGSDGDQPPEAPAEGQIYSFRTRPFSPSSPRETGRYAAFKVLGIDGRRAAVAALDGVWTSPPTAGEIGARGVLHEHRFAFGGRPAVFAVMVQTWCPEDALDGLSFAGSSPISPAERALAEVALRGGVGARVAALGVVSSAAEGEWRWAHDRAAVVAEVEGQDARRNAERAAAERRQRERLRGLTFDQLLAEDPFAAWTPSPPFPPEDFKRGAREAVHGACLALRALGDRPRRAAVRAVLKELVEWFNAADEAAGLVIMTEEREHICGVLWEMLHVARQKTLADEIELWRDW